ncbi:hypothetical protein CFOUR_09365 [Corynebacterium fournieri]|nr:hypothetical protein CFOUR_09365 [Corynebacterium fournieri]
MPDFTPSRNGASFQFGQTAKVVTEDVRYHVPVQWEVTVDKPTTNRAPRSAEHAKSIVCFPVSFTPVAIGKFDADVTVALPELSPIDGDLAANVADPNYCGEWNITGYTGELKANKTYTGYVASWAGSADPGIVGRGVELKSRDTTLTWR